MSSLLPQCELIDTCWDVNAELDGIRPDKIFGINRYMLGCKLKNNTVSIEYTEELIDTCWDVN